MRQLAHSEANRGHNNLAQGGLATHRLRTIRVLIVDHDLADVELSIPELKRAHFAISADVVQTPAEFTDMLGKQRYDVVLADRVVLEWTGLQALALCKSANRKFRSFW